MSWAGWVLPEWSTVFFALFSWAICRLTYRMKVTEIPWDHPSMSSPIGEGTSVPNTGNSIGAAYFAWLGLLSINNLAAIGLLIVWVIAAAIGVFVVPAFFGAMSRPTTFNVLLILFGAACLGFAAARVTLSVVIFALKAAIIAVVLSLSLALLGLGAAVLSGKGLSLFQDLGQQLGSYLSENIDEEDLKEDLKEGLDRLEKRTISFFQSKTGRHIAYSIFRLQFNACAIPEAIQSYGNMARTWNQCGHLAPPVHVQDDIYVVVRKKMPDAEGLAGGHCKFVGQQSLFLEARKFELPVTPPPRQSVVVFRCQS